MIKPYIGSLLDPPPWLDDVGGVKLDAAHPWKPIGISLAEKIRLFGKQSNGAIARNPCPKSLSGCFDCFLKSSNARPSAGFFICREQSNGAASDRIYRAPECLVRLLCPLTRGSVIELGAQLGA